MIKLAYFLKRSIQLKFIIILIFAYSALFSKVYYSKVDPYELRYISANASGLVEFIDENMIGKKLSSQPYLKIDAILNKKELLWVDEKLVYLKKTIAANENILDNFKNSLDKKRTNYKQIENLAIKSRIEKDNEFYDLVNSENSYLNTQKEINTLQIQIADLELRKAQLERNISDKTLSADGFILYSIDVRVGEVVNVSTPLAKIADTSKALLTIYLDEEDALDATKKIVLLDGKETDYKISRVLNIADSKNISKYKAQIVIQAPTLFSKLVKIELKEKTDDQ